MNTLKNHVLLNASLLLLPAISLAQEQAPASPAPAAPAASTVAPLTDQPVKLNPFEVSADSDKGYAALNSNSITRFNTELDKLPVSADIFDQTFMTDVAATTVEDMIQTYSAGAGYNGPAGTVTGSSQPGDRNGNSYIQLRGQSTPVMQRDGLMPVGAFGNPGSTGVGSTSNFDLERVEVIDGPQALLYSGGGPGGVINVVSKQARFGQTLGNVVTRVDQYGSKLAQMDYNVGTSNFAVIVSLLDQSTSSRRINIGAKTDGQYIQMAWKPFSNTTIRIETEQTVNFRYVPTAATLTAPTTDPRNGLGSAYLLAANETGATNPATGLPYPSGAVDNGRLNWSNYASYAGWQQTELTVNDFSSISAETEWLPWLSTQIAVGYDPYEDSRFNQTLSFYAPGASGNNLPGWTAGLTPGGDTWEPAVTKGIRFSALATNSFFNGNAKSQTIVGDDYVRTLIGQIAEEYVQADSNWNVVINPGVAQTGYTVVPKQEWSVDNGFVQYPLGNPIGKRITIGGVNYIRELTNPVNPALIGPANPTGAVLSSGNYILTKIINGGIFGANFTQWFDGKVTTMVGMRFANSQEVRINQGASGSASQWFNTHVESKSFNLGATYQVFSWLHPYAEWSSSYQPPFLENATDPYSAPPKASIGYSTEAGLKLATPNAGISGQIAYFHTSARDNPYLVSSTISSDINPGGLNGGGGGSYIDESISSQGVNATLTAAPSRNLRLRFSAAWTNGTLGRTVTYPQLYNDQFNENSSGQVTYADGTVVYVNPTFNSTSPHATATTPGAIPLTVTSLSTPGNVYFANPTVVNGAISSSSNAATVLKLADPVHGSILTGNSLLPISAYQLNTALTGIAPPGVVVAARAGQFTTGSPVYSVSSTGVYTFPSGLLNGFSIGGSVNLNWKYQAYYYYSVPPTTATIFTDVPSLYYQPDLVQFNLISSYTRKFRRVTWSTQLNITNLFNRYEVAFLPSTSTGFTIPTAEGATYFGTPRAYTWSNTIRF